MRRLVPAAVLACALGLLGACQPSLSGKSAPGVTANAVTGGAIETTALDAPKADALTADAGGKTAPGPDAKPVGPDAAAAQSAPEAGTDAGATAGTDEPTTAAPAPAPKPEVTETPAALKSEPQLACEKKKGLWAKIGKGDARACIFQTHDSGKRCERESQCEGLCLARSGTCAPFKPLFGCNDILQKDGSRVTLCLD